MSPLSQSLVPSDSGLSALREIALSGRPLVPLPRRERERKLELYLEFLRRRDGVPDRAARRLSRREPLFEELAREPVLWRAELDREAFERYLRARPPADLDPRLLWLLAAAKANRAERWAIERELARRETLGPSDAWNEFIGIEETYHTRILADACRSVGFDAPALPPPRGQRAFIRLLLPLPRRMRLPLTLAGEIFGCVAFDLLLERTDVFAERPMVVERLRRLVREILTDEAGHVLYCRSRLGALGLATARLALPLVVRVLLRDMPEFAHLAGGEGAFLARLAAFDLARVGYRSRRTSRSPPHAPRECDRHHQGHQAARRSGKGPGRWSLPMRSIPFGVGLLLGATLAAAPAAGSGPATSNAAASGLAVGTQDLRLVLNASPQDGSSLTGHGLLETRLPADGKLAIDLPYAAPDGGAPRLGPVGVRADYGLCGETRSRPAVSAGAQLQLPTVPGAGLVPSVQAVARKRLSGLPVLEDVRIEGTLVGGGRIERQAGADLATTLRFGPDTTGRAAVGFREAAAGGQTHLEVGVEHRISDDSSVSLMVTRGPSDPDYDLRTQVRWRVRF